MLQFYDNQVPGEQSQLGL